MEDNIFVKASRQMLTGMFDFDGDMNDMLHQGHTDGVRGIAVSEDSSMICTASWDKEAKLWCSETSECMETLQGHTETLHGVCFVRNSWIATSSRDGTVHVTKILRDVFREIVLDHDPELHVFNHFAEGNPKPAAVKCVCALGCAERIASGCDDKKVRIWLLERGDAPGNGPRDNGQWPDPTGRPNLELEISEDEKVSAICSFGHPHHGPEGKFDEHCADERLVTGCADNTVRVWKLVRDLDQEGGRVTDSVRLYMLKGHTGGVNTVCHIPGYGPHGVVRLASGSKDKSIRIWEIPRSTKEAAPESEDITTHKTLAGHSGEVKAICFLPTGPKSEDISEAGYLVSASTDRTSKVWNLDVLEEQEGGEMLGNVCLTTCEGHEGDVNACCAALVDDFETGSEGCCTQGRFKTGVADSGADGNKTWKLYTGADDHKAIRFDPITGINEMDFDSADPIAMLIRINKSFLFVLQSMSFPAADSFPWAPEIAAVQFVLPVFSFDIKLGMVQFKALFVVVVVIAWLANLCCMMDVYGRLTTKLRERKAWLVATGVPRYDSWRAHASKDSNHELDKVYKMWMVIRKISAVLLQLVSCWAILPITKQLLHAVDCTQQTACELALPDETPHNDFVDLNCSRSAVTIYNALDKSALINGTAVPQDMLPWTWDPDPSTVCFEGSHLLQYVVAVFTLLVFVPSALRMGIVDGDPSLLDVDRTGQAKRDDKQSTGDNTKSAEQPRTTERGKVPPRGGAVWSAGNMEIWQEPGELDGALKKKLMYECFKTKKDTMEKSAKKTEEGDDVRCTMSPRRRPVDHTHDEYHTITGRRRLPVFGTPIKRQHTCVDFEGRPADRLPAGTERTVTWYKVKVNRLHEWAKADIKAEPPAAKLCGTAAKYGWVHDSLCGCDRRTDAKFQHKIKFQKGSSAEPPEVEQGSSAGPKLEYNILSEAEVFRMEQRAAKAVANAKEENKTYSCCSFYGTRRGWWRKIAARDTGTFSEATSARQYSLVSTAGRLMLVFASCLLATRLLDRALVYSMVNFVEFVACWYLPLFANRVTRTLLLLLRGIVLVMSILCILVVYDDKHARWTGFCFYSFVVVTVVGALVMNLQYLRRKVYKRSVASIVPTGPALGLGTPLPRAKKGGLRLFGNGLLTWDATPHKRSCKTMDRALEDDHKVTSPKGPKPQGVPGSNNPDKEHDKTIDLANTNISIVSQKHGSKVRRYDLTIQDKTTEDETVFRFDYGRKEDMDNWLACVRKVMGEDPTSNFTSCIDPRKCMNAKATIRDEIRDATVTTNESYECMSTCIVREEAALDSVVRGKLSVHQIVHALEQVVLPRPLQAPDQEQEAQQRVRFENEEGASGWVSLRSSTGKMLLRPLQAPYKRPTGPLQAPPAQAELDSEADGGAIVLDIIQLPDKGPPRSSGVRSTTPEPHAHPEP